MLAAEPENMKRRIFESYARKNEKIRLEAEKNWKPQAKNDR
jgi:hypothetical protein